MRGYKLISEGFGDLVSAVEKATPKNFRETAKKKRGQQVTIIAHEAT